jgi:hypothetical protein
MSHLELLDARVRAGRIGNDCLFANPAVSPVAILFLRDNRAAGAENGRPLIRMQEKYRENAMDIRRSRAGDCSKDHSPAVI